MQEIRGESALILGFGREGKSVLSWLHVHYPTLKVGVADKLIAPDLMSGETMEGTTVYNGEGYLSHLSEYDTVIRSPGISPYLPEIVSYLASGGHMTSATNIFFSKVTGTTIGVTGTKGKSTTSSLIAHILESVHDDVRLVGNIGRPMLDALDSATDKTVFVVELSSHQLYDCRYSPHIAVMLGIVSEHLDYYPDLVSYANAKANIVRFQTDRDLVVYNPEHTILRSFTDAAKSKKITYSVKYHPDSFTAIHDGIAEVTIKGARTQVITMSDVPLLGNQENVLAAITVASLMGMSAVAIASAITPFKSLPHRLEFVGEFRGVRFYNDSLATIPQATIHALGALGTKGTTLIAGGYDRHLDFSELGEFLRSHTVSAVILFPDTGKKIWEAIGEVQKGSIKKFDVTTMEEAVRLAYAHTQKGAVCVLSPGSASYNLFRDYEDRGNQFKHWVRVLGDGTV